MCIVHHNPLHWNCDGFFDGCLLIAMLLHDVSPGPQLRAHFKFQLLKFTEPLFGSYSMRIMNVSRWAWARMMFLRSVQCAAQPFIVLIIYYWFIWRSNFWNFGFFSLRMWNRPWCVHLHTTDPSVAMHKVVCIIFVLCLVPVSKQLASIGPLAEKCSKLSAIHIKRRGAGRGQPIVPKQLPLSLGFKCACRRVFGSWVGMAQHRRCSTASVGTRSRTPCADPRNPKSISWTARGDHSAGILRQHDT